MSDTLDIAIIRQRMDERGFSQSSLAMTCGLSQPHLSKVLSGKVKAGKRTTSALLGWMQGSAPATESITIERLSRKLNRAPSGIRMQIMQILDALEKLVD